MHQRRVAFALESLQQPANMPLALADLLGGLPLRDQAFLRFLQSDQPVAVSLRHEKCSWIHLSSLTLSTGHFYLARLGHYHLAATGRPGSLTRRVAVSYTGGTSMYALVMTIHVVVCIFLIIVVLLQSGKAADLAGAFGGMGSQTAFGPRGSATLLSQVTTASAIVFMITSLSLSILATRGASGAQTVLDKSQGSGAPAVPGKAPAPA